MRRFALIVSIFMLSLFLIACSADDDEDSGEANIEEEEKEESEQDANDIVESEGTNVHEQDIDTTTADGYDRMTFKYMLDDVLDEKVDVSHMIDLLEDEDYLSYITYPKESVDTINQVSILVNELVESEDEEQEEATEEIKTFFKEQRQGEDEFIHLDLDDDPVRMLSVPNDDIAINATLNFSNHVINLDEQEAIIYEDEEIAYWDAYTKTMQGQKTEGLPVEAYRSWEELSNLEQAYLIVFGKQTELMHQLVAIEAFDEMDSKAAKKILDEFAWLGNEYTMFPEPQTTLDAVLYEDMLEYQQLWSQLANSDDEDAYESLIEQIFYKNEDSALQFNFILTQEHEDFIGADNYIELYQDM